MAEDVFCQVKIARGTSTEVLLFPDLCQLKRAAPFGLDPRLFNANG